ncbi:hypothetical protein DFH27DRAFT_528154 [Peziza echinospora]|nr:hypothetical protein DFH27DRAFT_528154 [Peziza echinospora]
MAIFGLWLSSLVIFLGIRLLNQSLPKRESEYTAKYRHYALRNKQDAHRSQVPGKLSAYTGGWVRDYIYESSLLVIRLCNNRTRGPIGNISIVLAKIDLIKQSQLAKLNTSRYLPLLFDTLPILQRMYAARADKRYYQITRGNEQI